MKLRTLIELICAHPWEVGFTIGATVSLSFAFSVVLNIFLYKEEKPKPEPKQELEALTQTVRDVSGRIKEREETLKGIRKEIRTVKKGLIEHRRDNPRSFLRRMFGPRLSKVEALQVKRLRELRKQVCRIEGAILRDVGKVEKQAKKLEEAYPKTVQQVMGGVKW